MSEKKQVESDLTAEFRRLGENFKDALQSAWESEERKQLSHEVRSGLNAMGEAIEKAAEGIVESPAAQRMKSELDDLAERVRSGKMADEVRDDLLKVLRKLNTELETTMSKWMTPSEDTTTEGGD